MTSSDITFSAAIETSESSIIEDPSFSSTPSSAFSSVYFFSPSDLSDAIEQSSTWLIEEDELAHDGITLARFLMFCLEEQRRLDLWYSLPEDGHHRHLLELFWSILAGDIQNPLAQLIIDIPFYILNLDVCFLHMSIAAPDLEDFLNRDLAPPDLPTDQILDIQEDDTKYSALNILFSLMKNHDIDFWAGALFYQEGYAGLPFHRHDWHQIDVLTYRWPIADFL